MPGPRPANLVVVERRRRAVVVGAGDPVATVSVFREVAGLLRVMLHERVTGVEAKSERRRDHDEEDERQEEKSERGGEKERGHSRGSKRGKGGR